MERLGGSSALAEKDQAELELEKLVFGDSDGFNRELKLQKQSLQQLERTGRSQILDETDDEASDELKELPDTDVCFTCPM